MGTLRSMSGPCRMAAPAGGRRTTIDLLTLACVLCYCFWTVCDFEIEMMASLGFVDRSPRALSGKFSLSASCEYTFGRDPMPSLDEKRREPLAPLHTPASTAPSNIASIPSGTAPRVGGQPPHRQLRRGSQDSSRKS